MVEACTTRQAFGHPVPQPECGKETEGSPASRVPLWIPCPLLDPGGVLSTRRIRVQACCLPTTGNRRLSPRYALEGYPTVHDYTHCGARSRGLHPRSLQLRTPLLGVHVQFAPDLLARALSGWDVSPVRLVPTGATSTNFMAFT